jgi:uncharacterized protein YdaU (DUF1376 family)
MEFDMIIDENSKPREKLKAWYLFTDDFIAGTQHLTNLEVGIYIRLLCWNWNKKCVGIPSDNITYYRIASCHTHNEREACDNVLREFFILMETNKYQNAKQLEEYIYITRRMEASRENGRLGGRPKKTQKEPSENPPTSTTTPTTLPEVERLYQKTKTKHNFDIFWKKVKNKVSKGTAEKNFAKLMGVWQQQPEYVAELYNKYYDSVEDKKFAKQPAFWLSARKYEDEEPKKVNNEKISQYEYRLEMFKKAIVNEHGSKFVQKYAQSHSYDVRRAIEEGHFTKEQAIKHLDMKGWL